jgi:hypothetical protein
MVTEQPSLDQPAEALSAAPDEAPAALLCERLWLVATFAGVAILALWLTMSRLQGLLTSDTLIPVYGSLYAWTWFYWSQCRSGQPLGLLASVISHPLHNLLFQNGVTILAGLMVFPLLNRLFATWKVASLGACVSLLLLFSFESNIWLCHYLTVASTYPLSLCVGLLSLHVQSKAIGKNARVVLLLSGLLFFVSFWVNLMMAVLLLPLVLWKLPLRSGSGQNRARTAAWKAAAYLVALLANLSIVFVYRQIWPDSSAALLSPPQWLQCIIRVSTNVVASDDQSVALALAGLLTAGLLALLFVRPRRRWELAFPTVLLAATAMWYVAVACAFRHVVDNQYASRYAIPSLTLISSAAGLLFAQVFAGKWSRATPYLALLLFVAVAAVVAGRFGPPSYARARAAVQASSGRYSPAALASGCSLLLGDYWEVYPAAFYANVQLYEQGLSRHVWPISDRCQEYLPVWWPALHEGQVALLDTPGAARKAAEAELLFGIPQLVPRERRGQIIIFTVMAPPQPTNASRP